MSLTTTDRRILRLAVPAFGALAAEPLYRLVDTAIVGRLGTNSSAGLRSRSRSCRSSSPGRTSSPTGRRSGSRTGSVPIDRPLPPTSASRRSGSRCSSGLTAAPVLVAFARAARLGRSVPATTSSPSQRRTSGSPRSGSRSCSSALPHRGPTRGERLSVAAGRARGDQRRQRGGRSRLGRSVSTSELPEPRGRPWSRR